MCRQEVGLSDGDGDLALVACHSIEAASLPREAKTRSVGRIEGWPRS